MTEMANRRKEEAKNRRKVEYDRKKKETRRRKQYKEKQKEGKRKKGNTTGIERTEKTRKDKTSNRKGKER